MHHTAPDPIRRPSRRPAQRFDWSGAGDLRAVLAKFLRRRCADGHAAEDLTHEALLRIARFRAGRSAPRRLRSWALQIAANVHLDHLRRSRRYIFLPDDDPALARLPARVERDREAGLVRVDGLERPLDEVYGALRRALPRLELRDRAVIDAYYGDGGSTERAARVTGVRHDSVKVRLYRARRRLEGRIRTQLEVDGRTRLVALPGEADVLSRAWARASRRRPRGTC